MNMIDKVKYFDQDNNIVIGEFICFEANGIRLLINDEIHCIPNEYIIDLIEKESNISDSDFSEEAAEYFKHIKWE